MAHSSGERIGSVGAVVGTVGCVVGAVVGASVGAAVGAVVGASVGCVVGTVVGIAVGSVGCVTGAVVGSVDGYVVSAGGSLEHAVKSKHRSIKRIVVFFINNHPQVARLSPCISAYTLYNNTASQTGDR